MSESQIPDSISTEKLAELALDRCIEDVLNEDEKEEVKGDGPFDGLTKGQLIDAASDLVDKAYDVCGDPMIHKMMLLDILHRLVDWHTHIGQEQASSDNEREHISSIGWLRDAGKLQAAGQLIQSVNLGDYDFTSV